jgi:hypothetical protein
MHRGIHQGARLVAPMVALAIVLKAAARTTRLSTPLTRPSAGLWDLSDEELRELLTFNAMLVVIRHKDRDGFPGFTELRLVGARAVR